MIHVLGMDPSLRNWGLAAAKYDPKTGIIIDANLALIQPKETDSKQVRQNCKDMEIAKILAAHLAAPVATAQVIFVEVPVGSQSARAMASYGVCVGILGTLQAQGYQIIEVTATEVKQAMTGNKTATKAEMIEAAVKAFPTADWRTETKKGVERLTNANEHLADAIGAIHAGIKLPTFQNLLRLLAATT